MATWSILLALVAVTLWLVRGALKLRFTPEAVAATVEKTFPQLDNHLINYLQLSRSIRMAIPSRRPTFAPGCRTGSISISAGCGMKERIGAAGSRSPSRRSCCLLPALFFGQAWAVAVWRTVNPFSTVEPPSLTKILHVQPGQSTVLQGDPLVLSCAVKGFEGHEVKVEIEPADAQKTLYSLGRIHGSEQQEFSYRLAEGDHRPALPLPRGRCAEHPLVLDCYASAAGFHRGIS